MLDLNEFNELRQESFHCHHDVLDEENDRNFVNASLKSERSFISAFRPDVLRETHQFLFVSHILVGRRAIGEIFLRLVRIFSSINSELRVTKSYFNLSGSDREFLQNYF